MELQSDWRLPVDYVPTGHNQLWGDNNPWAPHLPTVHKAHSGVFNSFGHLSSRAHVEVSLSWMEPSITEWVLVTCALDDVPEDAVNGADESEANPLVRLPAKRRHNQPNEAHTLCTFHRKQPPALCPWQTASICEDYSVVFSGQVTDDPSA